jgi:hypothetical protein
MIPAVRIWTQDEIRVRIAKFSEQLLGDRGLTDLTVLIGYFTSMSLSLAVYDVPSNAVGLKR